MIEFFGESEIVQLESGLEKEEVGDP